MGESEAALHLWPLWHYSQKPKTVLVVGRTSGIWYTQTIQSSLAMPKDGLTHASTEKLKDIMSPVPFTGSP